MDVLAGHLPFAIRDALPKGARVVTFLRDPVERTLSQYYGLLKVNRRDQLPGDGSLEAVLAEGNIIYDNLQTRMLSGDPEPVGDLDEEALEQARENLRNDSTVFGLVEHFDESLVLIKQVLDLGSITYAQQRVTQTRPRGPDVPEEVVRLARKINNFDDELYTWARKHFEQTVAEQGLDFAADVAAIKLARTGADVLPSPAAANEPAATWDLLVRTRADLYVERRESAEAAIAARREVRDVLHAVHDDLEELKRRVPAGPQRPSAAAKEDRKNRAGRRAGRSHTGAVEAAEARPKQRAEHRQSRRLEGAAESAAEAPPGKHPAARGDKHDRVAARAAELAALRDDAVARLTEVNERIRVIEASGGDQGSLELERLRREAVQLGKRVEQLTSRAAQFEDRLRQEIAAEGEAAAKGKSRAKVAAAEDDGEADDELTDE
jgi:Galactose-3-O-sulfotransferase